MNFDDKHVFTFYLDESLSFQLGQEVQELVGISLEPEISIQPRDGQIKLSGDLELSGEYVAKKEADQRGYAPPLINERMIDSVEQDEDGVQCFNHKFPVDISIPDYRVPDLDNISISVASFDYQLPEDRKLRLHAEIAIHGVENTEAQPTSRDAGQSYEAEEAGEDAFDEPASFETVFEEKQDQPPARPFTAVPNLPKLDEAPYPMDEAYHDNHGDQDQDDGRWKYNKKVQSFAEFFGNQQDVTPDYYEQAEQPSLMMEEESGEPVESSYQSPTDESPQQKKSLFQYLFHSREERYSQMKVCIVQENDTLDTLADKYDVPKHQISQANDLLTDDALTDGRIIYIPTPAEN
ncbi:stage VI sporulation protein D [Thalassobacillus sp. CUG 92003]|uniref:stage VI sporulation protein D n=1 Tax=Thalassobacillus sp. CUG 92003 TaxID=2736641 RepID=UPI0015E6F2CF